ncbi:hypothetical protein K492DRAFT_174677 [Lichtheimia hyalospora FSU 10163]|nr:hypothetical protein K492DRAFT_174677 [Lichtheimia hyalospora FSU 10163]
MGSKETSLLQRALLASTAARGMADAASAAMDQSEEEEEEEEHLTRSRRKSWPEEGATSGASLFSDDDQVYTTPPSTMDNMTLPKEPLLSTKNDHEEQQQQPSRSQSRRQSTQWPKPKKDDSYNIQKKTIGALECYQLDLITEEIKVLRFIASTDGATEHVALRTRHAADHAKDRKNSQHFYLGEGYVNATQMRKVARSTLGKGHFDAASESSEGKVIVTLTKGPIDCRGTWVPLSRARELLTEFKLDECQGLVKLLSDDPLDEQENQLPVTTATTDPLPDNQAVSSTDDDPIDDETFVKFEDDDDKTITDSTNTVTNIDSFVATNIPALPLKTNSKSEPNGSIDLFKALNLQDGSSEQQPSMPDLTKLLTTYLQSLSSTNNLTVEFKAALSRFPALEALLRKDTTTLGTENDHVNTSTTTTDNVVHTTTPTNPNMYITVVDNIAVCVAVLAPTETVPECRIMRRLDTNYINGTILLTAGGIETESERSMILSFEMDRRRVPKQKSGLYGTWIPLRRAQELAVTHSIQHRLGVFLSDNIEKFFPSPLPITISRRSPSTTNTKTDNHSLTSLALQALRNPNKHHPTTPSPSPLTTSATQIHQLLLSHNSRQLAEYAQKAPLLGTFDDHDDKRRVSVIDSASVASRMALATRRKKKQQQHMRKRSEDDGSDVDIVNSGSEADDDDDDTDTDNDVEEVRRRKKRMRDAAIEAMERGSSMDLEELLRRASSPIMGGNHRNPMDPRLISAHEKMRSKVTSARRRPQMQGGGGGGKIAPSKMKRSATWSGSMSSSPLCVVVPNKKSPSAKKQNGVTRPSKLRNSSISSDDDNRVVEHTPTPTSTAVSTNNNNNNNDMTSTPSATNESTLTTIKEDDEDEEIDIGGSDRDDDLR